jgi:hypothetical protein
MQYLSVNPDKYIFKVHLLRDDSMKHLCQIRLNESL